MSNPSKGRELRDAALAKHETEKREWIDQARAFAIRIATNRGKVTINDVRNHITLPPGVHPNTWGAVLKCRELQPIGFDQAHHPAAHARLVRVYQLKKAA